MSSIGRSPAFPSSSFDGELRAVALLLAQLDVGPGEPGDDADLERLGGAAVTAAAVATAPPPCPRRPRPEGSHLPAVQPSPAWVHLSVDQWGNHTSDRDARLIAGDTRGGPSVVCPHNRRWTFVRLHLVLNAHHRRTRATAPAGAVAAEPRESRGTDADRPLPLHPVARGQRPAGPLRAGAHPGVPRRAGGVRLRLADRAPLQPARDRLRQPHGARAPRRADQFGPARHRGLGPPPAPPAAPGRGRRDRRPAQRRPPGPRASAGATSRASSAGSAWTSRRSTTASPRPSTSCSGCGPPRAR